MAPVIPMMDKVARRVLVLLTRYGRIPEYVVASGEARLVATNLRRRKKYSRIPSRPECRNILRVEN